MKHGETWKAHKLFPSCPVAVVFAECSPVQNITVLLSVTGPWHWETRSVTLTRLSDQVYKRFEFYLSGHLEDTKYHYIHAVKSFCYHTEGVFNIWQSPLLKAESFTMSLFIKHELIRTHRKTVTVILSLSFLLCVPSSMILDYSFFLFLLIWPKFEKGRGLKALKTQGGVG